MLRTCYMRHVHVHSLSVAMPTPSLVGLFIVSACMDALRPRMCAFVCRFVSDVRWWNTKNIDHSGAHMKSTTTTRNIHTQKSKPPRKFGHTSASLHTKNTYNCGHQQHCNRNIGCKNETVRQCKKLNFWFVIPNNLCVFVNVFRNS